MTSKTKMIIITSDKDLIRQISLDTNKQTTSIEEDDNNTNSVTFLRQLFEFNSKNDHVYKRALSSPRQNRSKIVKTSKQSEDIICTICGDDAIGFNYNVISCAACKVFFRRYAAHQYSDKFKCILGQNQCSVAYTIRRKCQRCRLDRCFAMGMRTDFFISEEEKQRRKKHIDKSQNLLLQPLLHSEVLSQTLDDIDGLLMDIDQNNENILFDENIGLNTVEKTLSVEDWKIIETIRLSFLSTFQYDHPPVFLVDVSNRASALTSWSHIINQIILNMIRFFRQIDEFESLNIDDRFILIKYNAVTVFPILRCFYYQSINECCSYEENEQAVRYRQFFMLCGDTDGVRDSFIDVVVSLVDVTKQDPTLVSLLSAVLIFSQCLSMTEDQPLLKDSLSANRAQLQYTTLLWKYLISTQSEEQACRHFTVLITVIFRLQSVSKRIIDLFRTSMRSLDTVDSIAPLMQSLLHVS